MQAVVIVNPEAGAGAARRLWPAAARLLKERLGPLKVRFTERPGHAEEIARACAGCPLLIACGGDGTVNEVVNGLLSSGGAAPLGVLPLASGGDLARALGLRGLHHAVETLAAGRPRAVDVIRVRFRDGAGVKDRYCLNEASVGLGAAVTDEVRRRWRALPGRLRYMAGALRQLKRGHAYEIGLSLDGGEEARLPITTLALANGRYQGGGMHIAPRASMTDGLIDVTLIEHLSLTAALPHLHLLYTGGVYTHPKVRHYRARRVRIEGAPSTPVELDGDPLGVLPLEAGIAPGALQLLAPEGSSL